MKKFLIQTVNGHVAHDFGFHLVKAIEYHNWLYEDKAFDYTLSETSCGTSDDIPIGSLEYVFSHMERHHGVGKEHVRPINIPVALRCEEFSGRKVYVAKKEDIPTPSTVFIKSNNMYKGFTDVVKDTSLVPAGEYLVSEVVEMESEWRAFVQNRELVGLNHYLGDFAIFPDVAKIQDMITAYPDAPSTYTLDIAVSNRKTIVIEVHPFVSCGLYGFRDYRRLPSMLIQGYQHMKREAKGYVQGFGSPL